MNSRLRYFLIALFLISCQTVQDDTPSSFYNSQLFKAVQLAPVFKDSKTFVDMTPKATYSSLEQRYLSIKDRPDFNLRVFVNTNFHQRGMTSLDFKTDTTTTMYAHIANMWERLTREPDSLIAHSSRIPLPFKYVVPGGRFQEIYYWDSYFTMEGLLASDRRELATQMTDNFAFLLDSIGHIPNGTRDYYLSRSQPPFFSLMVAALSRESPETILDYLPAMEQEYQYFMAHNQLEYVHTASNHVVKTTDGGFLNRYYDRGNGPRPEAYKEDFYLARTTMNSSKKSKLYRDLRSAAESGWDFSSRWFGAETLSSIKTTSIIPVDLNCLMYHLELQISKGHQLRGNKELASHYKSLAIARKNRIQNYFWDDNTGYFVDFDFEQESLSEALTLAGVFPLYFGLATPEQAEKTKNMLISKFLKPGGLVTSLVHSGEQWDAPNGWAPLQWMAVKGLLLYGYKKEAVTVMERWLALNEKVFKATGKMMEKYNVEDLSLLSGGGEYETQDGFGWTNGVALGFKLLLDDLENNEKGIRQLD